MKTELIFFIIILLFAFSSQLLNPISKELKGSKVYYRLCPKGTKRVCTIHVKDGSLTCECV